MNGGGWRHGRRRLRRHGASALNRHARGSLRRVDFGLQRIVGPGILIGWSAIEHLIDQVLVEVPSSEWRLVVSLGWHGHVLALLIVNQATASSSSVSAAGTPVI
jgi:hypothetical protein